MLTRTELVHIRCCERPCLLLLMPGQKAPSPPVFADMLCRLTTPLSSPCCPTWVQKASWSIPAFSYPVTCKDLDQTYRTWRGHVSNDTWSLKTSFDDAVTWVCWWCDRLKTSDARCEIFFHANSQLLCRVITSEKSSSTVLKLWKS